MNYLHENPAILVIAAVVSVLLFVCLVMTCWLYWLPYRTHIGDDLPLEDGAVKIETDHLTGDFMAENCKP